MSEENNEVAVEEVASKPKRNKITNIITLNDGTTADFGSRKVLTGTVGADVTFKVANGEIISWSVPFIDGLNEFQTSVFVYGAVNKVKTALAGVKDVVAIAEEIKKQIESFNSGIFNTRNSDSSASPTASSSEPTLNLVQQAFARYYAAVKAGYEHWSTLTPEVIAEVLALWATKSKEDVAKIRKNPNIKIYVAQIQLEKVGTVEDDI